MRVGWPYLNLWVDLWIIQVGTDLFLERIDRYTKEWIGVRVTLFRRWGFSFRLYTPFKQRFNA